MDKTPKYLIILKCTTMLIFCEFTFSLFLYYFANAKAEALEVDHKNKSLFHEQEIYPLSSIA